MIKKVLIILSFVFISSSVFAFEPGTFFLYPYFAMGDSDCSYSALSGSDFRNYLVSQGNSYAGLQNSESSGFDWFWSVGAECDYFLSDSTSFIFGLSVEKTSNTIVYKYKFSFSDPNPRYDVEFKFNSVSLAAPAGLRYYFWDILVLGGGLYLGAPISSKLTVTNKPFFSLTDPETSETVKLGFLPRVGFFIDIGLFYELFDPFGVLEIHKIRNNITVFFRYRKDLTPAYKKTDVISDVKGRAIICMVSYGFNLN